MINIHAYKPGEFTLVYLNLISCFIYIIEEITITIRLGLSEVGKEGFFEKIKTILSFNSYTAIVLSIL